MKKYYVIATDPLTAEQEKRLQEVVTGTAWWHWLPNFWLVVDSQERHTVESLRDAIFAVNDSARAWVLEVNPITWSALTKKDKEGRSGSEWIKRNWHTRPDNERDGTP